MADISFKFEAEKLGKSIENLAPLVEAEINQAVKNLAHAAYAAMVANIQSRAMGDAGRKAFLNGLKFSNLGNESYLIYLEGEWANKLENGYGSYSLREVLLKSTKIVQVGSRTGEPWVRQAKDGHKWAVVPMEHHPSSNPTGDLGKDIKKLLGVSTANPGHLQNLDQIFKTASGDPINGKAAVAFEPENPNLKGLVKYQHVSESGKVSSTYVTYRAISEAGRDWTHPGAKGALLFEEARKYVESEMANIIKVILK